MIPLIHSGLPVLVLAHGTRRPTRTGSLPRFLNGTRTASVRSPWGCKAADQLGMVAIVSFFYGAQAQHLTDGRAVRAAVRTASRFLREQGYTNVIIEVANEMNIGAFAGHPIIQEPEGMAALIDLARDESGGMLVGCSGGGGYAAREVAETSDVILIHGNGLSRGGYYNLIRRCREWCPDKPIVCNEDSQAIGQLAVAAETHTSWGYYNNMSKQEPPTRWEILPGEDTYFASRVAELVGIPVPLPEGDDRFFLHGFEPEMTDGGQRWIRVGALRPEEIDMVRFFRNGEHYCTAYDEPFAVHARSNWFQLGALVSTGDTWEARIHLRHGEVVRTHAQVP
jgi:hypothetical protein